MKSKLETIPNDLLKNYILLYCKSDSKDLSSLISSSKTFHTLFQPDRLTDSFQHHVISGNQTVAEKMLLADPELMIRKGVIIDRSGRYFKNISPFEYILWALDVRYMANMMLNCLHGKAGLEIAEELKKQYEYFKVNGVTYTLDNQTITEKHYNFSQLVSALQTYVNNYSRWDKEKCKEYWCTVVGKAQQTLPTHMIQHYCDSKTKFHPTPTFTAKEFNRTLTIKDWDKESKMSLINNPTSQDLVLGHDFGLLAGYGVTCGWKRPPNPEWVSLDIVAIKALNTVRSADFQLLEQPLEYLSQYVQEQKAPANPNSCVLF